MTVLGVEKYQQICQIKLFYEASIFYASLAQTLQYVPDKYWVVTKSAIISKRWQNCENNEWWVKVIRVVNNGQDKKKFLPCNLYYLALPYLRTWTAENCSMSIIALLNIQTTNISFSCFLSMLVLLSMNTKSS